MKTFTGHLTDAQAQRLVDGLLDAAQDAGVEPHAAACAECAALVETYRILGEALDGLPVPELPADFTAGVLGRIELAEAAGARERKVAAGILAAVAAAACAALVAAGVSGLAAEVSDWAGGLGDAARALRIGSGVLPGLVSALRVQLLLGAAAVAVPLLVGLSRLMPAHRVETVA
jgi:anti-sigma factor RsiW